MFLKNTHIWSHYHIGLYQTHAHARNTTLHSVTLTMLNFAMVVWTHWVSEVVWCLSSAAARLYRGYSANYFYFAIRECSEDDKYSAYNNLNHF